MGIIALIISVLTAILIAIIFFLIASLLVYGVLLIVRMVYLSQFYEREDKENELYESKEHKD